MHATHGQVTFSNGRASGPLPISQIAIVVRDIDESLERYTQVLGWGPWNVYEHQPPSLHHTFLHGEETDYTMIGSTSTARAFTTSP
jgi:catechol 2,3-dioxygenase-like lactoylglutathione lyase family enzyme